MSENSTKKLIEEIESLPIEERARFADSVLKTLSPVDSEIEKKWVKTAEKRLEEVKAGKVNTIPGEKVFEKIQKRFSK
ncbi:MAG: addiction module protein [Balneolaceae bacterium]|nr:addiction module protein [Balneolaceae bacterium]